jgi:D-alanine-D-alanine ligase
MKFAIIFGGVSFEHEISIVSAITLKKVLHGEEPLFIFFDFEKEFYLIPDGKMNVNFFSSKEYKKEKKLSLNSGFFETKVIFGKEKFSNLKVINLVHGGTGEDGVLFSLLELYDFNVISPRREASVLSLNKELTKIYANSVGVETLDYEVLSRKGERSLKKLSFPIIIKPLNLGSSLGVSIVEKESDLEYALDTAFQYDDMAIAEPFIEGVEEYNIAGTYTTRLVVSNIEKPIKDRILDFDGKYLDFSRSETVQNADIDKNLRKDLIAKFTAIYSELFHGSIIRCDFFVIDGKVYLNEINSVPGSLSSYLFPDFNEILKSIEIPHKNEVPKSYQYIHQIKKMKGKEL